MSETSTIRPIMGLDHGIQVFYEVIRWGGPVGTRELARKMNLDRTKVNRLLGTLTNLGLVYRDPQHKYLPGPGVHVMSAMTMKASALIHKARPLMDKLANETGLTVALGLVWNKEVLFPYWCTPDGPVDRLFDGAPLLKAHGSSVGRILLSQLSDAAIRKLYIGELSKTKLSSLLKTLKTARRNGFASHETGSSIAVTVGDPVQAGLAVANYKKKKTRKALLAAKERLMQTAATLTEALTMPGYETEDILLTV